MSLNRVQVTIPAVSGISEDSVVNTWCFTLTADTSTIANTILGHLSAFYETFDSYKSSDYSWQGATAKFYSLSDPEPRVPWHFTTMSMTTAPAGTPLPHEVALCLSYRAVLTSGADAARRRGRVYLGPLNTAAVGSNGRPNSSIRGGVATGANTLLAASAADSDWIWNVYSPSSAAAYAIAYGWVDDEFDIQRRRGGKALNRSTFGTP